MEMLTNPGDIIMDLFSGTGNMGRQAGSLNRDCICIEQDQLLFDTFLLPMESS